MASTGERAPRPSRATSRAFQQYLSAWRARLEADMRAHRAAAAALQREHFRFGTAAALLAAISGSTVFATLGTVTRAWVRVLLGAVTLASASLAGIVTFRNSSARSERHQIAATRLNSVLVSIDAALVLPAEDRRALAERLAELTALFRTAAEDAPVLQHAIVDSVEDRQVDAATVEFERPPPQRSPSRRPGAMEMAMQAVKTATPSDEPSPDERARRRSYDYFRLALERASMSDSIVGEYARTP